MAEEEQKEGEEQPAGGKKKLIIIIIAGILIAGIAVAATLFFIGGGDDDVAMDEGEEVVIEKADPNYVDLTPPFTVNLHPDDPVGFLQISIQVLTYDKNVVTEIEKHKPLIRNNLVTLFGQQRSVDLRAPEGKEKLQKDTLGTIQKIIDERGSGGEVDNVFFTSFVMQ